MTQLSVNINKIATLRNARGGNVPNLKQAALDCERFGAQGITVHPRPDERHIRYQDVRDLAPVLQTEFNIEGYPSEDFLQLCEANRPAQVTLVPDAPDVLTSNAGWNTLDHFERLRDVCQRLQAGGMRVSLFIDCHPQYIEKAAQIGADRVELYTEAYAQGFHHDREKAIAPYRQAAQTAQAAGLGLNAGHDLDQENLRFFAAALPNLQEVSIGHALISEALYLGLENTIQRYLRALELAAHDQA